MAQTGNKGAIFWLIFGGFWLYIFFISDDPFNPGSDIPKLVFLSALPMGGGLFSILRKYFKAIKEQRRIQEQAAHALQISLLSTAKNARGKLGVTEVSLVLRIPIKKAEEILDLCVKQRVAEVRVSESGQIFYVFPEFLPGQKDEIMF